MKRLLSVFLVIMFCAVSTFADTPSEGPKKPTGFERKVYDSTLALYLTIGNQSRFACTTWPYQKTKTGYVLISAGHCVIKAVASYRGIGFAVSETIGGPLIAVRPLKATYEIKDDYIDWSMFDFVTDKTYTVLQFETKGYRIGDKVLSVNFSRGLGKQVSHGEVASEVLGVSELCIEVHNPACGAGFLVQLYAAVGSSGGAVISEKTHKVLGIHVFGFSGDTVGQAVEPIERFQKFLARWAIIEKQKQELQEIPHDVVPNVIPEENTP